MKKALKIGFSTTTQYWKSTLIQSKFLIFTFILAALLESFILHEVSQVFALLGLNSSYYDPISILNVNFLDFSDEENSLATYLSRLIRSGFFEFTLLNSFFLGVYYHRVGFPKEKNINRTSMDTVLDTPIETRRPTLGFVLQHVEKESRTYYFKILILFIVLEVIGGIIGNSLYSVLVILGYTYYWLFQLLPYLLLLLLYLKWLDLPFSKFWESKDKWILVIVCGVFVPFMGSYISSMIHAVLNVLTYAVSGFTEINNLMSFVGSITYFMLLVPFISIFYSQTLIYFKNEEEA
jgi:hypothetical protein